jgi:dihydropyrimidinase
MEAILLKCGKVVSGEEVVPADVLLAGGKIAAVGPALEAPDARVIDATGQYILPGGIDPHVHFALPIGGGLASVDDWESGSRAALAGGTTTVIDFVTPERYGSLAAALAARQAEAAASCCDWSLHLSVTGEGQLGELPQLLRESGCPTVKIYMAYKRTVGIDSGLLLKVMEAVAAGGGMVLAHCEDGDAVDYLCNRLHAQGRTQPRFHPESRPPAVEEEAVRRAVLYAGLTGASLYVVHVSTGGGMELIARAAGAGAAVRGEVCLHHLLLDDTAYQAEGYEAAKYSMSPPLRPHHEVERLWHFLSEGAVSVLSSDHCPFDYAGAKQLGRGDFRRTPNGVAGVQERLPLFYTFSVAKDRIGWPQFVRLTSENAARVFGLYPRKGVVAPGSDADLVVWDPSGTGHLAKEALASRCDYSIYEGMRTHGRPRIVIAGGEVVVEEGTVTAAKGRGRFLARQADGADFTG